MENADLKAKVLKLEKQLKSLGKRLDELEEDYFADADEEFEQEAQEALEDCEDIQDLCVFLSDYVDKEEIAEVIRELNSEGGHQFRTSGSEEKMLQQLQDSDELEYAELKAAIEGNVTVLPDEDEDDDADDADEDGEEDSESED